MQNNIFINRLAQINRLGKSMEIDLDDSGNLRTLSSKSDNGLFSEQLNLLKRSRTIEANTAKLLGKQFLLLPAVKELLQMQNIQLELSQLTPFAFGYRLAFQQVATWRGSDKRLPVYGGAIHIAMDVAGRIFSLSSTLRYGKVQSKASSLISKEEAIGLALSDCQEREVVSFGAKLMLYLNEMTLRPAYEVTIVCQCPSASYTYLVLAETGDVIEQHERTLNCWQAAAGVKARILLNTPDPERMLSSQTSEITIKNLPDQQILQNAYLTMLVGATAKQVGAKTDGSYCYGIRDAEFAAVSIFHSLSSQIELYLEQGMRLPEQSLPVVVSNPFVRDNAHFDPLRYEIHIGVGSGVNHGGLTKHIAFDLGVTNHEFGHTVVSLQTVGGDLCGREGAALNEAIGDVLGTLVMDYLSQIWYEHKLRHQLTTDELVKDRRLIGKYALPPFGIRSLKNNKKAPEDLTGEPHADGLIVGGALADLLIAMAIKNGTNMEEQIKLFTKMCLMSLALLPEYSVTFKDMLRAMVTADQQISTGEYRSLIERCFSDHGIILNTILG